MFFLVISQLSKQVLCPSVVLWLYKALSFPISMGNLRQYQSESLLFLSVCPERVKTYQINCVWTLRVRQTSCREMWSRETLLVTTCCCLLPDIVYKKIKSCGGASPPLSQRRQNKTSLSRCDIRLQKVKNVQSAAPTSLQLISFMLLCSD